MSRDERNRAVRAFMAKDNATVMLMSLKCGGVGLNLTRANREPAVEPRQGALTDLLIGVISLDMAWSHAVDDQAFDRVSRLESTPYHGKLTNSKGSPPWTRPGCLRKATCDLEHGRRQDSQDAGNQGKSGDREVTDSHGLRNHLQKNLADGSLGEGSGKKVGRLNVKQLAGCMSFSLPIHEPFELMELGSIRVGPTWTPVVDCDRAFLDSPSFVPLR